MEFKEVQENPAWDFKENPVVEGEYIGKQTGIGENKSTLYSLKQSDGSVAKVWGSTVLDTKMANVFENQYIQIKFLGMKPSPKRKGKEFKSFAVFIGE